MQRLELSRRFGIGVPVTPFIIALESGANLPCIFQSRDRNFDVVPLAAVAHLGVVLEENIAAGKLHRQRGGSVVLHRGKILCHRGDRVVIQPTPREEMTKSGIVLPDTAKEKPQEGKILAAGPGRLTDEGKREPMDVKEGDIVLYAKYAGTEFKVEGEELLIVSQKDILAIVNS